MDNNNNFISGIGEGLGCLLTVIAIILLWLLIDGTISKIIFKIFNI